ncbi:putative porin [Marinoscillum furvescens]|nr:putative porin [Marinoscillum furvescens]
MKRILTCIIAAMSTVALFAQITDDSTKLVYNANTTRIILESDLKNNIESERHPDTTLYELEKFTPLDQADFKYQDLGNVGTAMFPIFYPVADEIGRTSGLSAYDYYMVSPESFKYYNSKSPFMDLMVVFGGKGRSVVDYSFSRNVNENWNFGFDIYRITSDKQIGKSGQQDRNVVGTVIDLYTYYQHPEKPYEAMVHVANMGFNIEETGGIYVDDISNASSVDLFEYQDSDIQLSEARSFEDRFHFHLYHQYNWTKQLQFYHQLDIKNQESGYQDFRDGGGTYNTYTDYYDQFLLGVDSTYRQIKWSEVSNEAGVKGDLANLFYRLYLKRRDLNMDAIYEDPTDKFSEMFLGGYTRFNWRDKFNVEAQAELMQSGEYKLIGNLNSDLIFGSYKSLRLKPSVFSDRYFGNHQDWDNSFASAFTNEITGGIQLDLKWLTIRPKGRLLSRDKFIYYDENRTVRQSDEVAIMASIGGDFNLKLITNKEYNESIHLENEAYFTKVSGNGAQYMPVPEWFYNGRLFWRGFWFNNTMGVEVGVNLHAKSQYFAPAYAPEIQQFYLQDEFRIENFYTADIFWSMQVNNVRAFVRWTNFNQTGFTGYFITPYYPGQSRTLDFGVRWLFYD